MKTKLLLATTNKSKIKPFVAAWEKSALKDYYELVLPSEVEDWKDLDISEDTGSFELDALKKAKAYSVEYKMISISLDRGFEFDALGGWPSTDTKKVLAGSDKRILTVEINFGKGLEGRELDVERSQIALDQLKEKDRSMKSVFGIAVAFPDQDSISETVSIDGKAAERLYTEGFGYFYDWFFIPDGLDRPISMLSEEEYMKIASEKLWPIPKKIEEFLINKIQK